jgi:hypothetical protein
LGAIPFWGLGCWGCGGKHEINTDIGLWRKQRVGLASTATQGFRWCSEAAWGDGTYIHPINADGTYTHPINADDKVGSLCCEA